jgi:voltage-gated potassium channel
LYHAEHAVQPEVFSDIPHSLWWGVVTVTTVGYGDTVPMTIRGKIISTGIMMLGVILYGLPAAIFSHGFFDEFRERRSAGFLRKKHVCPHCGKEE